MPRRTPGTLLPLEAEILEVALAMSSTDAPTFHGFGLARAMRRGDDSRSLTSHGTLYKALGRLEAFGLLTSQWEDQDEAEGRPRRRLYELTGQGVRAATQVPTATAAGQRPRIVPGPA